MKIVHWFYASCAALILVIYFATNTWPASVVTDGILGIYNYIWCRGETWLREWIGATSGWAAAAIAGVTAIIIVRQIKTTERHHKENINRIELPERTTAKQAIKVVKHLNGIGFSLYQHIRDDKIDIYSQNNEFYRSGYHQIQILLDDPVFVRLQSIDTRLIAYYHKLATIELHSAVSSCEQRRESIKERKLSAIPMPRKDEFYQPLNMFNRLNDLKTAVEEAVSERFPDMRV